MGCPSTYPMKNRPYYVSDPDGYQELFAVTAEGYAELMVIMQTKLIAAGLDKCETQQLFDMVNSLFYEVNRNYEKLNEICNDDEDFVIHYGSKKIAEDLTEVIKKEFQSFKQTNDNND